MIEDPIVAEIRRFRDEHAETYGHDLKRICQALREFERVSGRQVVSRKPKRLRIERDRTGEEIFMTEQDVPIAHLQAVGNAGIGRQFGALAGRARIDERFFESLPESELNAWDS